MRFCKIVISHLHTCHHKLWANKHTCNLLYSVETDLQARAKFKYEIRMSYFDAVDFPLNFSRILCFRIRGDWRREIPPVRSGMTSKLWNSFILGFPP
jgi:hypothetical protein